ncbi:ROK family protein [Streptomyces sp. NPDC059786]|uniref:ROK family protein n=1 Tax=Streptomyces sp. NPDC059786 TaxID=3346946 RepID=UPI0036577699
MARRSAAAGRRDVPLLDLVRDAVPVPVALGQDLRAGALAEARLGAGRGLPGFVFVALGTGVGGAVVLDGVPLPGSAGRAAEIGHLRVRAAGDTRCGCGSHGCLETAASATALTRGYAELTGRRLPAAEIAGAVRQGDSAAIRVWHRAVDAPAEALTDCAVLLDPAAFVLGGGLSLAGDLLLDPLRAALARGFPLGDPPPVRAAALGDRAALIGAGLPARDRTAPTVTPALAPAP